MKCHSSQNSKNLIRTVVSLNLTYKEIEKVQKAKYSNLLRPQNMEMFYIVFQPISEKILENHGYKINMTTWMNGEWNKELEANQAMIEYSMIPIFSFVDKIKVFFGSEKKFKYSFSVSINLSKVNDQIQESNITKMTNEIALERRKKFFLIHGGKTYICIKQN